MIEPCGYRVLILPDKIEEKTAGGIYLPEQTQDREQFKQMVSTVIAIGEFAFQDYPGPWYKVGDRVITKEYPGVLIRDPDDDPNAPAKYRLINDVDVLAKIS